ncbi:hypothetical protein DFQ28_006229 [Apophysomyces sp. BC1034]|nr:hypothetical protein DFQ30_005451 [Apophysomyces sp. BC1015]KAG0177771.1 hypothetical protein DFQ29_004347 [Apophysomyces sp. BC1021]KAG0187537.1 hypothetical protein DFQ28_006229 [Apophysomyces sp. BC1034]
MDSIRTILKRAPATIVLHTLRTVFSMPPVAARLLIAGFTSPTQPQQPWIKHVDNEIWKGAYIAHNINACSDEEATQRVQNADMRVESVREKLCINRWLFLVGLAPQVKYPTPVLECVQAYEYLTTTLNVPGNRIIVSGDSAGGALCLEMLVRFYAPGILTDHDAPRENFAVELPAGMLLVSPLVSGEVSAWRWDLADMITPMLAQRVLKDYLDLPNVNPEDLPILRLRHITKDYHRFAPKNMVFFVGDQEVMRDDILTVANNVKNQENVNIQICKEDYPHDWFLIREIVPLKDKPMLERYDNMFVDFAARSVNDACIGIPYGSPETTHDGIIESVPVEDPKQQIPAVPAVQTTTATTATTTTATTTTTLVA